MTNTNFLTQLKMSQIKIFNEVFYIHTTLF